MIKPHRKIWSYTVIKYVSQSENSKPILGEISKCFPLSLSAYTSKLSTRSAYKSNTLFSSMVDLDPHCWFHKLWVRRKRCARYVFVNGTRFTDFRSNQLQSPDHFKTRYWIPYIAFMSVLHLSSELLIFSLQFVLTCKTRYWYSIILVVRRRPL